MSTADSTCWAGTTGYCTTSACVTIVAPFLTGVPSLHTEAAGPAFPDAFGPFRVLHQIGAGALGPVFRAYEPDQDRLVAVKLFRVDLPPERVHQLVAELEKLVAADLTHPSIAAPIAAGISGTCAYFAQDFVAADSLDIVVREHGPAPASDALRVAAQLGGALDFAATVDVLHGALHPRDVLVSPDDTRVIGLGVTRALERVGVETAIRRPYTAPERAAHGAWDRRADVFTLAALIYEMLAGKRLSAAADDAGDALASVPGVDPAVLRRVFAQALAEDPAKRFGTALEFADALKGALTVAPTPREARSATPASDVAPPRAARGFGAEEIPERKRSAGRGRPEAEVALPFEEPHPAGAFEIERGVSAADDSIDLHLRESSDPEPVIQLREEIIVEEPLPVAPPPATVAPPEPPPSAPPPMMVAASERPVADVARAVPDDVPPRRVEKIADAPPPKVPQKPAPAVFASPTPAPPSAFLDQASEEFRESALEKTRSAVWPLVLAIGVGLVVGFAGGYGVAMRDRLLPSAADSPATTVASVPTPAPSAAQPSSAPPAASAAAPGAQALAPSAPEPTAGSAAAAPPAVAEPAPKPASEDAAPKREAAAAATGRLVIRSTPAGARVSVDGKDAGVTPATVRELTRGPHSVRVTAEGFTAEERRIVLTDDRMSQAMRFEMTRKPVPGTVPPPPAGPGGLMVESRPTGASVFVDGKLVGTTPLAIESVTAGDHSIGLMSDGYQRWVGSVRVATGERARVTASLER